jgi:hypothetical protein
MLDAIQSISGVMGTSLEGERDVMMEILRQWMEFVEIEGEEERCGYRRIGGCFLLAMYRNSFFTKHNTKQNYNDSC